jgi:hypothetical protein
MYNDDSQMSAADANNTDRLAKLDPNSAFQKSPVGTTFATNAAAGSSYTPGSVAAKPISTTPAVSPTPAVGASLLPPSDQATPPAIASNGTSSLPKAVDSSIDQSNVDRLAKLNPNSVFQKSPVGTQFATNSVAGSQYIAGQYSR